MTRPILSAVCLGALLASAGCDRVLGSRPELVKFILADEIRSPAGVYVLSDSRFEAGVVRGVFLEVALDQRDSSSMHTPLGEWARHKGWGSITWAVVPGAVWINDRHERLKGTTVWVALG